MHPDPHVAGIARRFMITHTRPSLLAFSLQMVSTLLVMVAVVVVLEVWTDISAAGGIGAGVVGIGAAIWERMQASRLAKAYDNDAPRGHV